MGAKRALFKPQGGFCSQRPPPASKPFAKSCQIFHPRSFQHLFVLTPADFSCRAVRRPTVLSIPTAPFSAPCSRLADRLRLGLRACRGSRFLPPPLSLFSAQLPAKAAADFSYCIFILSIVLADFPSLLTAPLTLSASASSFPQSALHLLPCTRLHTGSSPAP